MKEFDAIIQYFIDTGQISSEEFNEKVNSYKKLSPVEEFKNKVETLQSDNATLLMMLAERDLADTQRDEQQAEMLMVLAEKGVL